MRSIAWWEKGTFIFWSLLNTGAFSICLWLLRRRVNSANRTIIEFQATRVMNGYKRDMLDNQVVFSFVRINTFNKFFWHFSEVNNLEINKGPNAWGYLLQLGDSVQGKMFKRDQSFIVYKDRIYPIQASEVRSLQFSKASNLKMQNFTIIGIIP